MRNYRILLSLLLVTFFALRQPIQRVVAHAQYDRAEPAADAILATPPKVVRIWFTEELFRREGSNGIEVYDATNTRVDLDDATIDDDDRTLMRVSLRPDLSSGPYTVRWKTLSADDGHEGSGEFYFTIEGGATTVVPAENTAETSATVAISTTATAQPTTADTAPAITPQATAQPTATAGPSSPSTGLSCLGVVMPLMIFMALELGGQRRHGTQARKP